MSILQDIYNQSYTPVPEIPKTLRDKSWDFFREVEKTMGEEFINAHWDNLCLMDEWRDYANFKEGFRLGVALMLEMR